MPTPTPPEPCAYLPQDERLLIHYAAYDALQYGLPARHRRVEPNPFPLWDGLLPLSGGRALLWTHPATFAAQPLARRYPAHTWALLSASQQLSGIWSVTLRRRRESALLMPAAAELSAALYGAWHWLDTHPGDLPLNLQNWLSPRLLGLHLIDLQVQVRSEGKLS